MTLRGYWPLNETSGNALDYSGNDNHGSLSGSPAQGATGVLGQNSYSLDGADDQINANFPFGSGKGTLSIWGNPDFNSDGSTDSTTNHYWFDTSNDAGRYLLYASDSNGTTLYIGGTSVMAFGTGTNDVWTRNAWNHIVITWDTSINETKLYVNGELYNTSTTTISATSPTTFYLGTRYNGQDYYRGNMCEVRAYNHVLTKAEIQYLYEVGQTGNIETRKKSA